jgi:hypothetical protein
MSGLEDFLKGIAAFNQGMTQFATARAVNDATEQVNALAGQEMDKNQTLQAQNQISQNLAMRLGAAGADTGLISQLTGQIAPSMGAQFQAQVGEEAQGRSQAFQKEQLGAEQTFQQEQTAGKQAFQTGEREAEQKFSASESAKNRQLQREKASEAALMAGTRAEKDRLKEVGRAAESSQKQFNALAKKDMDALGAANLAMQAVQSNKPIGSEFAKMALAKTQTGAQMSDAEREVFSGSKSYVARIQQAAQSAIKGNLTPQNQLFLADIAKNLQMSAQRVLDKKAELVSSQMFERAKKIGLDMTQEEALQLIYPNSPSSGQGAAEPQSAGPGRNAQGVAINPNKPAGGFQEPTVQSSAQYFKDRGASKILQGPSGQIKVIYGDGKEKIFSVEEVARFMKAAQ